MSCMDAGIGNRLCRMMGSRAGPAGKSALRGMLLSLALPERPTALLVHAPALPGVPCR